jgi:hypothetical protein
VQTLDLQLLSAVISIKMDLLILQLELLDIIIMVVDQGLDVDELFSFMDLQI